MPIIIQSPRVIKINSYHPLCSGPIGERAVAMHGYAPYLDGSCRREPDFEYANPTISALCRGGAFAPHLQVNDVVVYLALPVRVIDQDYRLVAILQVTQRYESHQEAYDWYSAHGRAIPKNCMAGDTVPLQFDHTRGNYKKLGDMRRYMERDANAQQAIGNNRVNVWNAGYAQKADAHPVFVETVAHCLDFRNPPHITRQNLEEIFGTLQITRTPRILTDDQLISVAGFADIEVQIQR